MQPNASGAYIERQHEGNDPKLVYVVTWWNTLDDEGCEDIYRERRFSTMDAALKFTRQILTTMVDSKKIGNVT